MNAHPLALTLLAIAPALAQPKPQFDVASIKQNTTCQGRKEKDPIPHPGALTIPCITLKELVQLSYVMFPNGGARNSEKVDIVGGPTWMDSEYFDLAAKSDAAPVDRMVGPMLQSLLEERFHLQVHRASKEAPVYLLTVAKPGPKLQPTKEGSCIVVDLSHPPTPPAPGQPRPTFCGSRSMQGKGGGLMLMTAYGMTMAQLAGERLPDFVGRPVLDHTGLSGMFDFQIEFLVELRRGVGDAKPESTAETSGAPIFTALAQQLGLKLESGKAPVPVLVIDRVEKLTQN